MYQVEQLVAGRWSRGTGTDELVVCDPVDGTRVSATPVTAPAEVARAVAAAREAAPAWAAESPARRAAVLHRVADALSAATEEIAGVQTAEMGKPLVGVRDGIAAGVGTLRQYAELGPLRGGRTLLGGADAIDFQTPLPRGVVGVLTPWNDPVAVACGLLGAALVTGNVVVHKPSERTPATGWLLARVFHEFLPPGVLSLVTGGPEVGAALAAQELDVVAHVGSSATGRAIAAACARTGAKAVLENGGNDALIVDAGVDPEWAAEQVAVGAFANSGQICVSVERVYVHAEVAEPFVEALVRQAALLRVGDGRDSDTNLGPLVDRRLRDLVHAQVEAAVAAGARLRHGGVAPAGPGAFYPPTVLTGCTDEMDVMRQETFGPVAPVMTVASFEEALARAADSAYGLAGTVLTPSMAHAQRAWRELPVGTVKINSVFGGAPGGAAQPRRGSGQGFGYGPELLDELTTTKVVHVGAPGGATTGW